MKIGQIKAAVAVVTAVGSIGGQAVWGDDTPKADTTAAAPAIAKIDIKGNSLVTTDKIMAVMSEKVGDKYDADKAKKDQDAIKAMGFFHVGVNLDAVANRDGGEDLTYSVTENPVIKKIVITANTPSKMPDIPASVLVGLMDTKVGAILNTNILVHDLDKLFSRRGGYTMTKGYIIDVSHDINIDPRNGALNIPLLENRIGAIKITGNKKTSTAIILRTLNIKPGDVINMNTIKAGLESLYKTGHYSDVGSFTVTPIDQTHCNVSISVVEGKPPHNPSHKNT